MGYVSMCPVIYKYISIDRYRYIDIRGGFGGLRADGPGLRIIMIRGIFSLITMCPYQLEKVDTWTQNLVTRTQPRSYVLSESGHKVYTNWTHRS